MFCWTFISIMVSNVGSFKFSCKWTEDRIEKVATLDIVEPSQCQGFNVLLAHADEDEESTYSYQLGWDAPQMIYECAGSVCADSTLLYTVHPLYRSIKDQTFATLCVVIRCIQYQVVGKVLCMCRDVSIFGCLSL